MTSPHEENFSAQELAVRTFERRAVEAAIWGMPHGDKTWVLPDIEKIA